MENFKNKTVIVTGGSRGIGKTICIEFAKLGTNVIFNYARNHNEAKKTKAEIVKYGVKCEVIKCNLNDPEQIDNFFTEVDFEALDIILSLEFNSFAVRTTKRLSESDGRVVIKALA